MNESSDSIRSAAGKHTGGTAADDVVLQEAEQLQDKAQPQHTAPSKIGVQLQRSGQPKNSALSTMSTPVKNGVQAKKPSSPYLRAENEDDDGYDPFSDRPAEPEPLFQRDPWN